MGDSYQKLKTENTKLDRTVVALRVELGQTQIAMRDAQKDFGERLTERDRLLSRLRAASPWALLRWRFFGGVIALLLMCAHGGVR